MIGHLFAGNYKRGVRKTAGTSQDELCRTLLTSSKALAPGRTCRPRGGHSAFGASSFREVWRYSTGIFQACDPGWAISQQNVRSGRRAVHEKTNWT